MLLLLQTGRDFLIVFPTRSRTDPRVDFERDIAGESLVASAPFPRFFFLARTCPSPEIISVSRRISTATLEATLVIATRHVVVVVGCVVVDDRCSFTAARARILNMSFHRSQ